MTIFNDFNFGGFGNGDQVTSVNGQTGAVVLTASDVGAQPANANLTAYAGGDTPSAFTLGIVDSANAAAWQTAIGAQPLDATLTAFAGTTIAADKLPYGSGADAFSTTDFTAAARTLLDDTTVGAMRTTLGLDAITYSGTNGALFAAGSATANSWPKLTPGTLLTTAENGALELDTKSFYVTTIAGNRGVVPSYHLIRQDATYTLANQGTAQQAFNASANGRLTLGTGAYIFEAMISISGMSATSGNCAFLILGAGGATIGSILYIGAGVDSAAGSAGAGGFSGNVSSTSANPIVPGGVGTAVQFMVRGTFEITVAGTIVPSITLGTAIGTAVVAIGSYFFCTRIGSTTLTTVGAWD